MSVNKIWIVCIFVHNIVRGFRAELLIIVALVIGIVGHTQISRLHARHIASALHIVWREGKAETEAHI